MSTRRARGLARRGRAVARPRTPRCARVGLTALGARARTALTPTPRTRRGGPRMDLNYTAEDIAFRKSVRAWLEGNLPRAPLSTLDQRRAWHRKLYEAGYLGMGWPKEYGGGGARPMEQAIGAAEMARINPPAPTSGLGLGIVGPTIVHGTDAQKRRYLRKILLAEEMWCQLY